MTDNKLLNTIIGIRAVQYNSDIDYIHQIAKKIFPEFPIYIIVDCTNGKDLDEFPDYMNVIEMNDNLLELMGLYYKEKKIGWVAGDYAYYACLKYGWDYMWLLEPDLFIGQDAFEMLNSVQNMNIDLIGTNIGIRSTNWPWTNRLRATTSFHTVSGVFFPITRVSRRLALESLKIRQEISTKIKDSELRREVPNDESVIATTCNWKRYSSIDLREKYPKLFTNFGWRKRFDKSLLQSGVVHPAHDTPIFIEKVIKEMNLVFQSSPVYSSFMQTSLKNKNNILSAVFNLNTNNNLSDK